MRISRWNANEIAQLSQIGNRAPPVIYSVCRVTTCGIQFSYIESYNRKIVGNTWVSFFGSINHQFRVVALIPIYPLRNVPFIQNVIVADVSQLIKLIQLQTWYVFKGIFSVKIKRVFVLLCFVSGRNLEPVSVWKTNDIFKISASGISLFYPLQCYVESRLWNKHNKNLKNTSDCRRA